MDRKLALEEIRRLFLEAGKAKRKDLANRYVLHARKIASALNIRLPLELKRRFCRKCGAYFTSKNLKVRTSGKCLVYSCLDCGKCWKRTLKAKSK